MYMRGCLNFPLHILLFEKLKKKTQVCLPGGSAGKESACNAGDLDSVSELGRSPGEGNDYPLQYPCLENSMDRGSWRATVHGAEKSWTRLSD